MEYEILPAERFRFGFRELWQYRELFYFFTWRDVRVKYKQTLLGFAWAILQPLFMMLVFTLFFGKNANNVGLPYPLFAFSGLVLWNVFSTGISSGGNSMVTNANIIKKIYFPRLIIPISSTLVAFFDFLMTLPILAAMMAWYKVCPSWTMVGYLPLSVLLTLVATIGPACLMAALNVKYRDFRYAIPFLIQFALFVTPVIYPAHYIQNALIQKLLALNPMSAPITLFRAGINGETPDLQLFAISCCSAVVLLAIGVIVFRKTERYFADLA